MKTRGTLLAILCVGLIFSGSASATIVFSENFEGVANDFSVPIFNYSDGYTLPNDLSPGGGSKYGWGNIYAVGAFPDSPITGSLLVDGLTGDEIDAGLGTFNFEAQFSTYKATNDFAQVTLTFKDESNADVGSPVTLGGAAFVAALATGTDGYRAWGADSVNSFIPIGARSFAIRLITTRVGGTIDDNSYVDNIALGVGAVPEPGVCALLLAGAGGLLLRRRR